MRLGLRWMLGDASSRAPPVSGLSIKDGAEVESGGRRFIIMQLIGFDYVVARDIERPTTWCGWPSWTSTPSRSRLQPCRRCPISARSTIATGRGSPASGFDRTVVGWDAFTSCGHRRAGASCRPGRLDALPLGPGIPGVGAALVAASV
jgi:hypothetical protein